VFYLFTYVLPVIFYSYLSLFISEQIFEPADSLYSAPCSSHLDKMFSSKVNSEFTCSGAPSSFLCFSLASLYGFTLNTIARLALSCQVQ
jgi:hypothetical protein